MRKRLTALFVLFVLVLAELAILPVGAWAIAQPDTALEINESFVYEDVKEPGDVGVWIDYYIDYAALPTETATTSYLVAFIDTTGLQIKAVAPYAYGANSLKGYRHGIAWIYFSAVDVTTYGLSAANKDLYQIWIMGNPTVPSGWTGDPPKTVVNLDDWFTLGDPHVQIAQLILESASALEIEWPLVGMTEVTALGTKIGVTGEDYFLHVIPGLSTVAPAALGISAGGAVAPTDAQLDFSSTFGATMTNGTGIVTGSTITFAQGNTTVTVTQIGNFVITLEEGTSGTMTNGTGLVTGSPVTLVGGKDAAGENTVVVTQIGNFVIALNRTDTQGQMDDTVAGTAFDLSLLAAAFGMSPMMMSGMVWLLISILVCAAVYKVADDRENIGRASAGKIVFIVFDICIIGGTLLGMIPLIVAILLFLGYNAFIGYILFFRPANV